MGNKPVYKAVSGNINVAMFEKEVKTDSGTFKDQSISIQRGYKDKDDKWQNTNSIKPRDIPKVKLLLDKIFEHVCMKIDDGD